MNEEIKLQSKNLNIKNIKNIGEFCDRWSMDWLIRRIRCILVNRLLILEYNFSYKKIPITSYNGDYYIYIFLMKINKLFLIIMN